MAGSQVVAKILLVTLISFLIACGSSSSEESATDTLNDAQRVDILRPGDTADFQRSDLADATTDSSGTEDTNSQGDSSATDADVGAGADADIEGDTSNLPPVVSLISPKSGLELQVGAAVLLKASATDDGEPGGLSFEWVSQLDGTLGQGPSLMVNALSPGKHVITVD